MKHLLLLLFTFFAFSLHAQKVELPLSSDVGRLARLQTGSSDYFQNDVMNKYDIRYLKLDLNVIPNNTYITGSCTYSVTTTDLLDTFAIELYETMVLDSLKVNNVKSIFTRSSNHVYIAFDQPFAAATSLNVQFFYKGYVAEGIYAGKGRDNFIYTANVSESFQAREWFPAKQLLNDKIDSADIWITTTNPYLAGSNGLLKAVVDVGGNKKQFQWSTRYPMSYYMPAFSVGSYVDYKNYAKPAAMAGDSILIQHLVASTPGYFANIKGQLDKTPRFIEKMSALFGLYPFAKEKYGHMQAFIGGGMEHQTMSTMQDFSDYLIVHELCHQWFGDNVTCATWNDIWLNESFATYSLVLMLEQLPELFTTTPQQQMFDVDQHIMSLPDGSVYVPLSESYNENRIFDPRLTYNKGSAVIHNLRFEMQSDTLFFNTLKTYQMRFKDTFATTTDFKNVAEEVTGKNFTDFFNQWIYGEGFPTYNVTYSKQGTDTLVLNVNQTTSAPSVTPLFTGLMEYKIKSAEGDTIIKVNHTANSQTFKIFYTKFPTAVETDPNNWVVNGVGTSKSATNNWIGSVNNAWENAGNWSWGTVPDSNTDVVLNAKIVFVSSAATCKTLTVNTGAKLIINPGFSVDVAR